MKVWQKSYYRERKKAYFSSTYIVRSLPVSTTTSSMLVPFFLPCFICRALTHHPSIHPPTSWIIHKILPFLCCWVSSDSSVQFRITLYTYTSSCGALYFWTYDNSLALYLRFWNARISEIFRWLHINVYTWPLRNDLLANYSFRPIRKSARKEKGSAGYNMACWFLPWYETLTFSIYVTLLLNLVLVGVRIKCGT